MNLKRWATIHDIVLVRTQLVVAYIRLKGFVVKPNFVVTDKAVSCAELALILVAIFKRNQRIHTARRRTK